MGNETNAVLVQSNEILKLFENLQTVDSTMQIQEVPDLGFPVNGELRNNEMCFYRINQLVYDEDYPHREAFENVLSSMDNESFNFVYVLTGTAQGIELCIGVVRNQNEQVPVLGKKLSAVNYGDIIKNVFSGNFSGSRLEKLRARELDRLVGEGIRKYENAGVILGIPAVNETDTGEKYDFQGIDRLINSMLGLEWRLVIVCEPVSKQDILTYKKNIYELYNRLSVWSKRTVQHSVNNSTGISFGENTSDSRDKNWGYNTSDARTHTKGTEANNSSSQHSSGRSEGQSRGHSEGKNKGVNINKGSSDSVTIEIANKHAEEIMQYISDDLLERLKVGFSKGLFKTSVYYMAEEPTHAYRLKAAIMALFQGSKTTYSPLTAKSIDLTNEKNFNILRTYQNQYIEDTKVSEDALMLLGRPFDRNRTGLNTYLTTEEISLLAGLPQKEVPGIALKEGVEFGLNVNLKESQNIPEKSIHLGKMMQRGGVLEIPFFLSKDSMAKHTFIAGVTGSGKTTTCHKLLSGADMPFLVIEPAKTEYRTLIRRTEVMEDLDITVFTLGNETGAPFRINPFELIEGEIISAHVDMVKATFTSAFPMEASMPQLLEEAIYKCYEEKGWDVNTNRNINYDKEEQWKAFVPGADSFPKMSDLLAVMKEIVESKGFSQQMQADYIGSLVSRLSNLTVGSKGSMLDCQSSTDFRYIAHHNVILEMEELKSPEDKALFMGFILSRLSAVIRNEHKRNSKFKHLTLIEEAHRLLSKVEYGDSGSKKSAVETFTDLLAEVRKYGEGLIIVDQIPNKLAPEVLKNTNTKIIHKILARDDKEVVGDTMLMDDKQKEYLSALSVGETIIFSEQTDKPVHVKIEQKTHTDEEQVPDDVVRQRFEEKREALGSCYQNMEIMALFPQFDALARALSFLEIDDVQCDTLKKQVNELAEKLGQDKRKIWEELIKAREGFYRKDMKSAFDQSVRVSELTEFFTKEFEKGNLKRSDMYRNYTKPIQYYLR